MGLVGLGQIAVRNGTVTNFVSYLQRYAQAEDRSARDRPDRHIWPPALRAQPFTDQRRSRPCRFGNAFGGVNSTQHILRHGAL